MSKQKIDGRKRRRMLRLAKELIETAMMAGIDIESVHGMKSLTVHLFKNSNTNLLEVENINTRFKIDSNYEGKVNWNEE